MESLKTFYVGVKGVVIKDTRVLILKRKDKGGLFWDLPGGRINENETIEQTLTRELREEAIPPIATIQIGGLLHAWRLNRNLKDGKGLLLLYYRVFSNVETPILSKEHIEYKRQSSLV